MEYYQGRLANDDMWNHVIKSDIIRDSVKIVKYIRLSDYEIDGIFNHCRNKIKK